MTSYPELASGRPRVERDSPLGRVQGFERAGAQTFLGLPYARPVGRFRPAAPASPGQGVYDATTYAPQCPQPYRDIQLGPIDRGGFDEDCLYLNVHVPVGGEALPVPVWIHGGGFTHGSANECDGTALAVTAEAVVVSINYRLGLLGWLDLSEVGPDYGDSADAWLTDQIQALRWVQDNIAAFGGDPGCVTIIGESAGAASVLALCGSERARGLFHRAVACSPPHMPHQPRADLLARIARKRRLTREAARDWVLNAPAEELGAMGFAGGAVMTSTGPVLRQPVTAEIAERGSAAPPSSPVSLPTRATSSSQVRDPGAIVDHTADYSSR